MPRGKPSLFHTRSSVSGCPATRLRGTFYCSLHCLLGGKIAIDSSTIHPPTHDQAGCARGTPVAPRVLRPIPRRPTPKIKRLTHPNSRGHEGQRFRSVPFAIGCLHNEHTPDSFTHVTSGAQTRWSSSVSHSPRLEEPTTKRDVSHALFWRLSTLYGTCTLLANLGRTAHSRCIPYGTAH
jgi:hypothetical protein